MASLGGVGTAYPAWQGLASDGYGRAQEYSAGPTPAWARIPSSRNFPNSQFFHLYNKVTIPGPNRQRGWLRLEPG